MDFGLLVGICAKRSMKERGVSWCWEEFLLLSSLSFSRMSLKQKLSSFLAACPSMSRQRPKPFFMWSLIYAPISFTWPDASHFTLVSLSALYAVFSLFKMLPSGSSQAPKKQDHITPVSASLHCLVVRFRIDFYLSVKTFIVWLLISPTFYTLTPFSGASAH